jgi:hypothetical protein
MNNHIEDTRYVQWQDGMYVMLDDLGDGLDGDLGGDYELALVENSLRDSKYFRGVKYFNVAWLLEDRIGVNGVWAGYWFSDFGVKLTREQALYIATGETQCTKS